uniref:Uncharacterized protein n=1 Tax=Arundo donax TaxID=35708 RepID=A0A0A9DVB7_ARUDO
MGGQWNSADKEYVLHDLHLSADVASINMAIIAKYYFSLIVCSFPN